MKHQSWPNYFAEFFDAKKEKITNILDASSCREIWIQGEMYLHSPHLIRPNCYEFPGERVDLHGIAADGFPEMISEMKVIGYRGYACSDIFGSGGGNALAASLNDCKNYAPDYSSKNKKLAHSLYKDYQKLRHIKHKIVNNEKITFSGERYLILIVPHRISAAGSRGKNTHGVMQNALEKVMFSQKENSWEWNFTESNNASVEATFSVRLWRVDAV